MPPVAQQIRFCRSQDGTRIAYAVCGQGAPLVWVQHWVHHLNLDWESPIWRPWVEFLAQRYTILRYDWRGCGLSDRDNVPLSIDAYSADLAAVVAAAGFDRYALFGMAGAGSGLAMLHAAAHPQRVGRLVVSGSHVHGRLARKPEAARVEEANTRLKVFELGWPNETPAYGQFFTALHIPDGNAAYLRAYDGLLRKVTSPANTIGLLRSFWEADFGAEIPKVQAPTLVLHSRGDCIVPFEHGREVAALIPDARFVPLESRNHIILDTEPAWLQVQSTLDEFLRDQAWKPASRPLDALTAREREILNSVAQGLDNHAIGARLSISEKTVRNHVSTIFSKLGVNSRPQAIVWAREAGFGRVASRTGAAD